MKKQVELSITHNGKDVVAYPYSKKEHVQFENGMNIDEFVGQDIATPTITHDTTAIKVGVGDSDVSGSVVDGTVNMTIKGQTYQNILPEPTLRNKMIGKSMQRLNEGYDNIEVVDGVSKSAILSGQTLVNICKNSGKDLICTNINSSTSLCYKIKDNTWYYLIINVKQNTLNKPFRFSGWTLAHGATPMSGSEIGTSDKDVFDVGETGVKRFKIGYSNIPEDKGKTLITFVADSSTVTGQATYDIMLLEYQDGMENWDIPYFEGMQSVKMPVLTSIGKNLFNGQVTENAALNGTGDLNSNVEGYCVSDFVEIKSNTQYIKTNNHLFAYYDENKKFISRIGGNAFLTPSNAKFVRMNIDTSLRDSFQLEQGAINTPFEPYKSNILTTPEEIVLRSLPNGVCDTLNLNTGEYVQRIGEITANELEPSDYYKSELELENTIQFGMLTRGREKLRAKPNAISVCNIIPVMFGNDDVFHARVDGGTPYGSFSIWMDKTKLEPEDVFGLIKWLRDNNAVIQYELATPIVKTVD